MLSDDTACGYLTQADECLKQLDAAEYKYSVNKVSCALISELDEFFNDRVGLLLLTENLDIATLRKGL